MSCTGSSDSSDDEKAQPRKPSTFSIDNLLNKSVGYYAKNWLRCQTPFHSKQVCAMPPNIVVPKEFLQNRSLNDMESLQDHNFRESLENERTSTRAECSINGMDDASMFKKKRPRTAFSVAQVRMLETEFEKNRYLTGAKRKELSRELKLSETQIKIWFQNRRTKLKRKNVSDMESWVQQLYSPLGAMAPRPLIVGDHLYLFNTNRGDTVCQHFQPYQPQMYPPPPIAMPPGYLPLANPPHKLPKPFE